MDIANGLTFRLKQILSKLKLLNIVRSYTLKIDFGRVGEDLKDCLLEVNALLRKCVKKIRPKPRRAEIRNVIGELVRKKNTKAIKGEQSNSEVTAVREIEPDKYQKISSEKKHLCELCGVEFIRHSTLKIHMLKFHESGIIRNTKKSIVAVTTRNDQKNPLDVASVSDTIGVPRQENSNIEGHSSLPDFQDSPADLNVESFNRRLPVVIRNEEGRSESGRIKNYMCSHTGCQKNFQSEITLNKHIRLIHNTSFQYHCSKCDKAFSEKAKLNRHMLSHQLGQFECSKCNRTFHRKDNLKRHITLHYGNMNAFECKICKKKFSLKFNRDTHESNVHTSKEIHCESCGKKCKNEATLKIHMRLHGKNRISCSLCCKTFTRKAQYRNHLKNKHKGMSPYQKLFDSIAMAGSHCSS